MDTREQDMDTRESCMNTREHYIAPASIVWLPAWKIWLGKWSVLAVFEGFWGKLGIEGVFIYAGGKVLSGLEDASHSLAERELLQREDTMQGIGVSVGEDTNR